MVWLFCSAVAGIPVLFAAIKMRQLEAYHASVAGAVIALLPLTPGVLIGIPAGLWAMAVLSRRDVRSAFGIDSHPPEHARETRPASAAEQVRLPGKALVAVGILNWIFMPICVAIVSYSLRVTHERSTLVVDWPAFSLFAGITLSITTILCVMMIVGGLKLQRLSSSAWPKCGAVAAILLTPGNLIGLPVGIWVLVSLGADEVRSHFESCRRPEKGPRFSRSAIVGAVWAPFFFAALLCFVVTTTTHEGGTVERRIRTTDEFDSATGQARAAVDDGAPSFRPDWWQWVLILTVLPLGLTAPFGTTGLGLMSISSIRHSDGRLIGMPLAVADTLLFPLLILDGLIVAVVAGLTLLVASLAPVDGVFAVWAPMLLIATPVCVGVDILLARTVWRQATHGLK